MKPEGYGWVTVARLAREAGVGESTVTRALARVDGQWVQRTTRGHRITGQRAAPSTYLLLIPTRHLMKGWPIPPRRTQPVKISDPTRHLMTA